MGGNSLFFGLTTRTRPSDTCFRPCIVLIFGIFLFFIFRCFFHRSSRVIMHAYAHVLWYQYLSPVFFTLLLLFMQKYLLFLRINGSLEHWYTIAFPLLHKLASLLLWKGRI